MSGKGKDEPRVGYADEDIALTQKLARPKMTREKPPSDLAATLLKPTQGGAVDAGALRRVRKVSAPNHVAIREMPAEHEPMTIARPSGLLPGSLGRSPSAEATVARIAAIPVDAYPHEASPFSEVAAPSTTRENEEPIPPSTSDTLDGGQGDAFDDVTERGEIFIPESRDVESLRSMRGDAEPVSLVTKQVPADVVKILRSRAALESEVVRELAGDAPTAHGPESLPVSSQAKSEALVLTKLAGTLDFGVDAAPSPRPSPSAETPNRSPLASTQLSDAPFVDPTRRASLPEVTPSGGTPAPKPAPQLHTLPLGMKPADFMAGLAAAGSIAPVQSASPSPQPEPGQQALASSGQLPTYASSNHLPAAQPSSGVFPQGGPQRYPSGSLPAQSMPQQVQQAQQPQPTHGSGPHAYPSGMMPAPVVPGGTFPPGMMQAPMAQQAPGHAPAQGPFPGAMQGPMHQGTYPPGMMQAPMGMAPMQAPMQPGQGTFPPGSMQAPMPQGTFPPGSMQAPMPQGTFPPGSMQAPMPQGTFPPGSMQAPMQHPMQPGQGTFPPGSMQAPMQGPLSNASFSQVAQVGAPPSSGANAAPSNGLPGPQAPQVQGTPAAAPRKSKSGLVLLLLFVVVVLACVGAWFKLKHKPMPWKHGAHEVPTLVAPV